MEHSLTTPSQGSLGWFNHMEHSLTTPSQGSSGWFTHMEHYYTFTGQFGMVQSHGTFLHLHRAVRGGSLTWNIPTPSQGSSGWFNHMEHSLTTPSQGSLGWFDHMEHSLTTPAFTGGTWCVGHLPLLDETLCTTLGVIQFLHAVPHICPQKC